MTSSNVVLLPLCAGSKLISEGGDTVGRLGLLVISDDGAVYGLTVSSVIPVGKSAAVRDVAHRMLFNAAVQLDRRHEIYGEPATAQIVALRLFDDVLVKSNFMSFDEPQDSEKQLWSEPAPFYLVRARKRIEVGSLAAVGSTAYTSDEHGVHFYYDVAEIYCPDAKGIVQPGDAGGAIATADGKPVGILIGATSSKILFAPLAPFLAQNKFAPLSSFSASRWNGLVTHTRDIASAAKAAESTCIEEEIAMPEYDERGVSSADILSRNPEFSRMIAEYGR